MPSSLSSSSGKKSKSRSQSRSSKGSETCLDLSFPFPFSRRHYITITRLLIPLLAALVILCLVLSGISGPQSGLWFVEITYQGDGRLGKDVIGDVWQLGGLGGCLKDDSSDRHEGQTPPSHWGQIHSLLIFHLATSAIFFLIATVSWILLHFPSAPITRRYGTLIPLSGPLFPLVVLIADIAVYHRIQVASDVDSLMRQGTYWLGPSSFPLSVFWLIAIQYDGYVKRQDLAKEDMEQAEERERRRARHEQRRKEREAQGFAGKATSWWPWSGTAARK